jgi:hypothetical protein
MKKDSLRLYLWIDRHSPFFLSRLSVKDSIVRVGLEGGGKSQKKPHQELRLGSIVMHPSNEIALLFTQQLIRFDYHVGRICLPQPVTSFEGRKRCSVTGWGTLSSNGTDGPLLQTDVSILSENDCKGARRAVSSGALCAVSEPGRTLCIVRSN